MSIRTNEQQTRLILSRLHAREEQSRKRRKAVLRVTAAAAAACIFCGGAWIARRFWGGLSDAMLMGTDKSQSASMEGMNGNAGEAPPVDDMDTVPPLTDDRYTDDGNKIDGDKTDGDPTDTVISGDAYLKAFLGKEYAAARRAPLYRAKVRAQADRTDGEETEITFSVKKDSLRPPDETPPESYLRELLHSSSITVALFGDGANGGEQAKNAAKITAEADPAVAEKNGELFFKIRIKETNIPVSAARLVCVRFASEDTLRDCIAVWSASDGTP